MHCLVVDGYSLRSLYRLLFELKLLTCHPCYACLHLHLSSFWWNFIWTNDSFSPRWIKNEMTFFSSQHQASIFLTIVISMTNRDSNRCRRDVGSTSSWKTSSEQVRENLNGLILSLFVLIICFGFRWWLSDFATRPSLIFCILLSFGHLK